MKEMVSVIIPVYNTAAYLEQCVRSVLAQTWSVFEVLLVDDGSSDESAEICRTLCTNNERIRFIQQTHNGVSAARNNALRAANGSYLFFLDSDDAIHPYTFEMLIRAMCEKKAEIGSVRLRFAESEEFSDLLASPLKPNGIENKCIYYKKSLEAVYSEKEMQAIGGKMIRREIADGIFFDETLRNAEDSKFIYQIAEKGASLVCLDKRWYYYRKRSDSASHAHTIAQYETVYRVYGEFCHLAQKRGDHNDANKWREKLFIRLIDDFAVSRTEKNRDLAALCRVTASAEINTMSFRRFSRLKRFVKRVRMFLAFYTPVFYRLVSVCFRPVFWLLKKIEKSDT